MEEEESTLLEFDEVEIWADQVAADLRESTGRILPRLSDSQAEPASTVACRTVGAHIPAGALFYPCCGSDTKNALELFGDCVADAHFADPYRPPRMRASDYDAWTARTIAHIGTFVTGPSEMSITATTPCSVHSHRKDGLLALIEDVPPLSVFYYRGDSIGEGGSNQHWLGPVLLHVVLAKLLNGGLIATSGGNCGCAVGKPRARHAVWEALCSSAALGDRFDYANRKFTCVRPPSGEPKGVSIWQVELAV